MKKSVTFLSFLFLNLALSAQPEKVVLVEEGTGTWCQWCPRGDIYGQTLAEIYPDNSLFVAIHQGDVMENEEYYTAANFTGLPNGNIDRAFVSGLEPSNVTSDLAPRLALSPPASVSVSTNFDQDTRKLEMTITANFVVNLSGDYRLAGIVVEDGITGPSPAYNQSNSYSGGANGPMGGYEDLPSPVSASIMVYNHVGRYLAGGYNGETGSLPTTISDGDVHAYTYVYTLPEDYNEEYVRVIGILVDASNGEVLNAGGSAYLPGYDNGKPFFHSSPQELGFIGLNYQYDILTHDPEHDDLIITALTGLPAGISLINLGDGKAELKGIPTNQGTFEITLNVSDGEWNIEQTFQLTIGEPESDWLQVGEPGFSATTVDLLDIEINGLGEPYAMITESGQIYLYKFENETWTQQGDILLGDSFHAGMAISPDNTPYIFSGGTVSKLVAGQWEQVGATLPGGTVIFSDIIIDVNGTPFVVYFNPPSTTNAYQFDGTDWVLAGTATDGVGVWNRFHLDEMGNPLLIYGTDGANIAYSEAAQWDGTDWNLLGDSYIEPSSQTYFDHDVAITPNGDIFAALTIGVGIQQLNIYQLVGGSWELIAENLAGGATENCNLEADSEGNIIAAFRDESNGGRTSVMKYDGNDWNYMGLAGFTNIASGQSLALDPNDVPYVAYRDTGAGEKVSVKKFEDLTGLFNPPTMADYQLNIYPNPNTGQFILEYAEGSKYQVFSVSGQLISEEKLNAQAKTEGLFQENINLSGILAGIYYVKIVGNEGMQVIKMVKK